jgi:hypothetical protein
MNKLFCVALIGSVLFAQYSAKYDGSTLAAVNLAGGIIKATHVETVKKYKRSECPVCKGKGWYISGDKITEVPCGYCEPDKKNEQQPSLQKPKTTIIYNR